MLEAEATRVQHSLLEARMSPLAAMKLAARIDMELDVGDSLRLYMMGRTGERQSRVFGAGVPFESGAAYWLM